MYNTKKRKRVLSVTKRFTVAVLFLVFGACVSTQKPPSQEVKLLPLEASTEALLDNAVASVRRSVTDPVVAESLIAKIQNIKVSFAAGDDSAARQAICDFTGAVDAVVESNAISRADANLLLDLAGTILGDISYSPLCKTVNAQPGPGMLAVAAASACVQRDPDPEVPFDREQCNRVAVALQTMVRNTGLAMCGAKAYGCQPVDPNACPAPASCQKDVLPFLPKVPGPGETQPQVQLMGPIFTPNAQTCAASPDGPHECSVRAIWECICSCTTEAI
jgi:hypothetical protein